MTTTRYRKRPVTIDAIHWTGREEDLPTTRAFLGNDLVGTEGADTDGCSLLIRTLEHPDVPFTAPPGWWVLRGVRGEHYACEPGIFTETYEPVDCLSAKGPATPTEDRSQTAGRLARPADPQELRLYRKIRAEVLLEAADTLVRKYGVTNRAAADLRRAAAEAAGGEPR